MDAGNALAEVNNNAAPEEGRISSRQRFEMRLYEVDFDGDKEAFLTSLQCNSLLIQRDLSLLMEIDQPLVDSLLAPGGALESLHHYCYFLQVNDPVTRANLLEILWKTNEVVLTKLETVALLDLHKAYGVSLAKLHDELQQINWNRNRKKRREKLRLCGQFFLLCAGTKVWPYFINFAWLVTGFEGALIATLCCLPFTIASVVNYYFASPYDVWWKTCLYTAMWGGFNIASTYMPLFFRQDKVVIWSSPFAWTMFLVHPKPATDILSGLCHTENWSPRVRILFLLVNLGYQLSLLIFGLGVLSKSFQGYTMPADAENTMKMHGLWKEAWGAFTYGLQFMLASMSEWDGWTGFSWLVGIVGTTYLVCNFDFDCTNLLTILGAERTARQQRRDG